VIKPNDVITSDNIPAAKNEIIFVIEKLCLLKGLDITPDQETAIVSELLDYGYTRKRLLFTYESLKGKTTYARLSIDDFINESDTMPVLVKQEAINLVNKSIADYKAGLNDEQIKFLRIDTLENCRKEYNQMRTNLINGYMKEFFDATEINYEKLNILNPELKAKFEMQLKGLSNKMKFYDKKQ